MWGAVGFEGCSRQNPVIVEGEGVIRRRPVSQRLGELQTTTKFPARRLAHISSFRPSQFNSLWTGVPHLMVGRACWEKRCRPITTSSTSYVPPSATLRGLVHEQTACKRKHVRADGFVVPSHLPIPYCTTLGTRRIRQENEKVRS